jgi:hypothetical protein
VAYRRDGPRGPAGHHSEARDVAAAGEWRRPETLSLAALGEALLTSRKTRVRLPAPPLLADWCLSRAIFDGLRCALAEHRRRGRPDQPTYRHRMARHAELTSARRVVRRHWCTRTTGAFQLRAGLGRDGLGVACGPIRGSRRARSVNVTKNQPLPVLKLPLINRWIVSSLCVLVGLAAVAAYLGLSPAASSGSSQRAALQRLFRGWERRFGTLLHRDGAEGAAPSSPMGGVGRDRLPVHQERGRGM